MELSAPLCFELLWGMLCPWLRNMFPCVSDKVNTCDAKDRVLSTSVSIDPAGKLRDALGNGWPATKFAWQHSSVIWSDLFPEYLIMDLCCLLHVDLTGQISYFVNALSFLFSQKVTCVLFPALTVKPTPRPFLPWPPQARILSQPRDSRRQSPEMPC